MTSPPANTAAANAFECDFGTYRGEEPAVLAFRNATRPNAETREYLEWRYETPSGAPPPVVCWLRGPDQQAAGMAALIFRRYWVNGQRSWVPVAGDIGLRSEFRGRGLGRVLLAGLTNYLRARHADVPAFVLPTEVARRTLALCGWQDAGKLVPHVFLAHPDDWLRARMGGAPGAAAARLYSRVIRAMLRDRGGIASRLEAVGDFDALFDAFGSGAPPDAGIARCLDAASLRWRYARNPRTRFEVTRLVTHGRLDGFMIASRHGDDLHVCDVAVAAASAFVPFMRGVLAQILARGDVRSVRLSLADGHPLRPHLRRLFFIARPAEAATFQVLPPADLASLPGPWHVTSGDKDI